MLKTQNDIKVPILCDTPSHHRPIIVSPRPEFSRYQTQSLNPKSTRFFSEMMLSVSPVIFSSGHRPSSPRELFEVRFCMSHTHDR